MKKKLVILGLAGALLFSGLSVSAMTDECRHPKITTCSGTERYRTTCSVEDCVAYDVYGVTADVCEYCNRTLKEVKVFLYTEHSKNHN